jgi:lysozyme family protein
MTDRFDICLPFTLIQECPLPADWSNPKNFSNDKHDPGGETMCGITQREYDADRKHSGEVCQDVKLITQTEGEAIYRQSYWMPDCPALPAGIDLVHFDSSVNEGCTEATRILQFVLGIKVDGLWGPQTAAKVAAIQSRDVPSIIRTHTARRKHVYGEMKGFKYFGEDWLQRSTEIGAEAIKMVTA